MGRQRLAGRKAEPHPARHVFRLAFGIGKHGGIKRRHREKHRRLVSAQRLEHGLRRRPLRIEHRWSRRPTSGTTWRRRGHRRRTASARKRSRRLHGCRCGPAPRCARCSSASNAHASCPSAFRWCRTNRASRRPHRRRFWPAPSLRSRPPTACPAAAPTPGLRRRRRSALRFGRSVAASCMIGSSAAETNTALARRIFEQDSDTGRPSAAC